MRDMKTITVKEDVGAHIIKESLTNNTLNKDYIIDLLFKSLDEHSITTLLGLLTSTDEPYLPKVGDVVYYTPGRYDTKIEFNQDILKDHSVYTNKSIHGLPSFYAVITGDTSYNENINSWYYKFNVEIISNNSSGNLELLKESIKWEDLQYGQPNEDIANKVKRVYEAIKEGRPELPF